MIKHVVLFKFKNDGYKDSKTKELETIKQKLEELKGEIDEIKDLEVGLNINNEEEYDMYLNVVVDTFDDVATYAKHPKHQEVLSIIKLHLEKRACVDCKL